MKKGYNITKNFKNSYIKKGYSNFMKNRKDNQFSHFIFSQ